MGKKKEKYLYRVTFSCDDVKGPVTYGARLRYDRSLSKAILKTSKKEPKKKYSTGHVPKEWR